MGARIIARGSLKLRAMTRPMPFSSPEDYAHAVVAEGAGEGWWFVFRGDRLLVEIGPPDARTSDDPRVPSRPSWARVPRVDSRDALLCALAEPLRTLYLGSLGGAPCWAAEMPAGKYGLFRACAMLPS